MEKKRRDLLNKIIESRIRRAIALVLAVIVTFTMTYSLVLPAITLEKDSADTMPGISMGGNSQEEDASTSTEGKDSGESSLNGGYADTVAFDAEAKNKDGETETLVHVEAEAGAFPEGTTMEAAAVADQGVIERISDSTDGEVIAVHAVDLTFSDENGETVQPAEGRQVSVALSAGEGAAFDALNEDGASDSANRSEGRKGVAAEPEESDTVTTVVQYTEDNGAEPIETNDDVSFLVEPETDLDQDNAVSFDMGEQTGNRDTQTYAIVETVPETGVREECFTDLTETEETGTSDAVNEDVAEAEEEEQTIPANEAWGETEEAALTARDDNYIITMTYGTEANIPMDARLQAEEILSEDQEYKTHLEQTQEALNQAAQTEEAEESGVYAGPAAEEDSQFVSLQSLMDDSGLSDRQKAESEAVPEPEIVYARFFDITILDAEGNEVIPAAPVRVSIELLDTEQDEEVIRNADTAQVIHFGEEETEVMEAEVLEDASAGVMFDAAGFSVYGVVYTVDFTYEGGTWSFPGQGSYRLEDILAELGIEGSIENAALTLTKGVENTGALYLTQTDGEYYINSDIAFMDTYELRVRIGQKIYIITVTDQQESDDLRDFLTKVTVSGAQLQDGKYVVEQGKTYAVTLSFKETANLQFDNEETLTYQLPDGIVVPEQRIRTIYIAIVSAGVTYEIPATETVNTDGSITVVFDQDDPNYHKLASATNVGFRSLVYGYFTDEIEGQDWGEKIDRDILIDSVDHSDVFTEKNGTFDEETGRYTYTIKVKSSGNTQNVNVKDVISGNALIFNNDVAVSVDSSRYTINVLPSGEQGFDYTFASMADGEEIIITYTASLNPSEIPENGNVTVDLTRNTVTVQKDGGDPHTDEYSHHIELKIPNKSNGNLIETDENGNPIYSWTIDYNTLALVPAAGNTVTDTIASGSQQFMKYKDQVTVKVYDHSGILVDTRTFTPQSDSNWSYTIPSDDTTSYRYVFEYQTVVDQSAVDRTGLDQTLTNTAGGPGGSDPGGITVIPNDKASLKKEVVSSSTEEITWLATLYVPEGGLDQAVVTDLLPNMPVRFLVPGAPISETYFDYFKPGSLQITGELDGETHTVDYQTDRIVITFSKDGQPGLKGVTGGHEIKIKLTTEVDQTWLEKGLDLPTNSELNNHVNTIDLNSIIYATAGQRFVNPGLEKIGTAFDTGSVKYYKYTLIVKKLETQTLSIYDEFNTSLLEVYDPFPYGDWNKQVFYMTGVKDGQRPNYGNETSVKVNYTETENGIRITSSSVPLQDNGEYYPEYMITYFLRLKDGVDLDALAVENGGEFELTNQATWGDYHAEYTFTTEYDFLNKELIQEATSESRKVKYCITFNSKKGLLNGGEDVIPGEDIILKDTLSANLSVDYTSIQITTDPVGVSVPYSLSGDEEGRTVATYRVPNGTAVTITYDAMVVGNGPIVYDNTAEALGKTKKVEGHVDINVAGVGEGTLANLRITKVDGYDASKKLAGVQFKLYASDGTPIQDRRSDPAVEVPYVILTTDENGVLTIDGDELEITVGDTPDESRKYYLEEMNPPEGYQVRSDRYQFTLVTDADEVDYSQGHWVYFFDDSFQIKNWPLEGLVVGKRVESIDESDYTKDFTFEVSILKQNGAVDTSVNGQYGDMPFDHGVAEIKLRHNEQKAAGNLPVGTRFKVEEKDADGYTVSTTVGETTSEGPSYTGVTAVDYTLVTFTNTKEEASYSLPYTGGPGTKLSTVLGAILIAGAGVVLCRRWGAVCGRLKSD